MKSLLTKVTEAADYLARVMSLPGTRGRMPSLAIILGSGLGEFSEALTGRRSIPYSSIPHFPQVTVAGHAGTLSLGRLRRQSIICLEGRTHYYEGCDSATLTLPVRVLGILGIRTLILTNAAGGLNPRFRPGNLMLIQDHLSLFIPNPLIGPNPESLGPRFPDMSQCYSIRLRDAALRCARTLGLRVHQGIYVGVTGPSYETPAEIRMLRRLGADAIGMSTVPEVIVACHMKMECLGISVITNLAVGLSKIPLTHEEVITVGQRAGPKLTRFLDLICRTLSTRPARDS